MELTQELSAFLIPAMGASLNESLGLQRANKVIGQEPESTDQVHHHRRKKRVVLSPLKELFLRFAAAEFRMAVRASPSLSHTRSTGMKLNHRFS